MNASRVAKTSNDHIVNVLHLAVDPGDDKFFAGHAILTEFCSERDLASFLTRRQNEGIALTPLEVRTLAAHLLTGLCTLHDQSVSLVHRDISPRNIFIARNAAVEILFKVGDYGRCKFLLPTQSCTRSTNSVHSTCEREFTFKSDVFAVAVVLQEAMKLDVLNIVKSDSEELAAEHAELRRQVQAQATTYGQDFIDLVQKMMHPNPAHRETSFTSASARAEDYTRFGPVMGCRFIFC